MREVSDVDTMYELYDPVTVIFLSRNKLMMIVSGTVMPSE